MKCPNCGYVTNWDTLQCPCGYDAEKPVRATAARELPVPPDESRPQSPAMAISAVLIAIWVVLVIVLTAGAAVFFFFVFAGTSIGANDGANRLPALLVWMSPAAGALLMAGGVWFIVRLGSPRGSRRAP
jgi:hypothetical protein